MMPLPFQSTTRNFCSIPNYVRQQFVIVGAPTDSATTFRSGARMGPNAIRDASLMLTDGTHDVFPVDLSHHVGDAGDMALPTGNTPYMLSEIESNISSFLDNNRHVVTLGGDHSITLGILRAMNKKYGKIGVVHFDAHCDTWSHHFGEAFGHGTWLYHAIQDELVDPSKVISIGIRSPADEATRLFLKKNKGWTISARHAMNMFPRSITKVIKDILGSTSCYMSLDIDCLDPAYAPGTGTPEIGGLSTIWLSEVIELLSDINWVGMDCVEVAPAYDHSNITALAAATFCWQYLSMNIHKTI